MRVVIDGWAWLDKSEMTPLHIDAIKIKLTIRTRKMHPKDEPKTITLYHETDTHLAIPREFFIGKNTGTDWRGAPNELVMRVTKGRKDLWPGEEGMEFNGTLRPSQQTAFDNVVRVLERGTLGGIVSAPTGWGKTVWACALMAHLKVPTLVVVHNKMLMDQWVVRIKEGEWDKGTYIPPFLPNAEVGIIGDGQFRYKDCHVVIAMVQTLVAPGRKLPKELYRWPGLLIPDEVHRVGAPTWSKVPPQFPTRYRVGLSATPRRKDGADNVFFWHIGPLIHIATKMQLKPKIKRVWTRFRVAQSRSLNPKLVSEALLLRFMMSNPARNGLIVRKLIEALKASRRVILMTKRLKHIEILETLFVETWTTENPDVPIPSMGRCVGGISKEELADVKSNASLILSTFQYTKEGFDSASLDTIFLAMPISDAEQSVGRILRTHKSKKAPIVVDFRDDEVELFAKWGASRDNLYDRIGA